MHRIIRWQHHSVERLTGSVGSGGKTPTPACSHLSSGSTGSQQFFWQAVCHGAATAMIVPQSQFCIYLRWSEKTSWFSGRINDRITIFVIWGKVKEQSLWTGNKLAFFIRSHRDWISLIAISQCYIVTLFFIVEKNRIWPTYHYINSGSADIFFSIHLTVIIATQTAMAKDSNG